MGVKRVCPVCHREYETILEPVPGLIQVAYPNAPPWQREQLLSGICSDGCWNDWFGEE